jgi:sugar-specific transcriptional regulator TrmB
MTKQAKAFTEMGLTDTEGKIMESLIVHGPATGSVMATRLGINKSVAYFVLDQLAQKGLVSFLVINKKREYRPIESGILANKINERKKEFMKNFGSIQDILKAAHKKKKRALFKIFEGWDGMKIAFYDIIPSMKAGSEGEFLVFAVDTPEKIFPRFRRFIKRFHTRRSAEGIKCRLLISSRLRSTIGKDRKKESHTDIRFISSEHSMPMVANIYANKVLLALWTSPPLAITIEDADVADSFRSFFHMLWKTGK